MNLFDSHSLSSSWFSDENCTGDLPALSSFKLLGVRSATLSKVKKSGINPPHNCVVRLLLLNNENFLSPLWFKNPINTSEI